VSVQYATQDGTATAADADYIPLSGTLRFLPGETVKTLIVLVRSDARAEANETLSLVLSNPVGAPIYKATSAITIQDDDTAGGGGGTADLTLPPRPRPTMPTVSVADARVVEGNSGVRLLSFVVTLSSPATGTVSVRFRTVGRTATAGSDFVMTSGQLRFARGASSQTVQVTVRGDQAFEADETLTLELFDVRGITLGRAAGIGTIVNDDVAAGRLAAGAAAFAMLASERPATRRA
jgi:chitinase